MERPASTGLLFVCSTAERKRNAAPSRSARSATAPSAGSCRSSRWTGGGGGAGVVPEERAGEGLAPVASNGQGADRASAAPILLTESSTSLRARLGPYLLPFVSAAFRPATAGLAQVLR
jgi:hypothetical protein